MLTAFAVARLQAELGVWERSGRRPQLWWRDDDALADTPALRRLISIAEDAGVTVGLAVIPSGLDPKLCRLVNGHPCIWVLQHGVDHRNNGNGARPNQFSEFASAEDIAAEIFKCRGQLAGFRQSLPIYVPPWNSSHKHLEDALSRVGFRGVSMDGQLRSRYGLSRTDVHLDLLKWEDAPRFRGRARLLTKLTRLLNARRRARCWSEPIGLLTHHLDHDEKSWAFFRWLLAWEPLTRSADWRRTDEVFQLAEIQKDAAAAAHCLR